MSANGYIANLKRKNPRIFAAKEIKLTAESFEKQVRAAFESGHASGKATKSIFEEVFGK